MNTDKERISLIFLGTGSAVTKKGRYPSGVVIDKEIIVDFPPQAYSHLKRLDTPPENLEYALITHFHPDHVLGIVPIIQEWLLLGNRKKPLNIIGPPGLIHYLAGLFQAALPGEMRKISKLCRFCVLPDKGGERNFLGLKFEAIPLAHFGLNLGYRIWVKDKIFAISGDTGMCDNLPRLFDADVTILEMTTVFDRYPTHLNFGEHFLQMTEKIRPDSRLFLYHLCEDTRDLKKMLRRSKEANAGKITEALKRKDVIIPEDLREYLVW